MEKIYDEYYCEEQIRDIDREIKAHEEEIKMLNARKFVYGILPQMNETGNTGLTNLDKGFYSSTNNHREGWRNVYDDLDDFKDNELPYIKRAAAEFGIVVSAELTESAAVATNDYFGNYAFRLIYTLTFHRNLEESMPEISEQLIRIKSNKVN